ncbi:MAG: class I SAM-dependent methyltransferase [Candidatus Omnitrophota bacterium]
MYNGPFACVEDINEISNQGERYVPLVDPYNAAMHLGHMASYKHALRCAYGKKILDLGCGVGYGSHFLASFGASEVVAADCDSLVVDYARRNYSHPNLRYVQMDCNAPFPFDDQSFDLVFSSQAIEHIRNPLEFMKEIRRVLRYGNFCIITTPNQELFSPDPSKNENQHHINEMNFSQLESLGRKIFKKSKMAGIPQNCLIATANGSISVKSNEDIVPDDYRMRVDNVSECENLLLFAHTREAGKFVETLPPELSEISRSLDPLFWDPSVSKWIVLGKFPKSPQPGKDAIDYAYGSTQTTVFSPFDNLYRIDVGLQNGGDHNINITLRRGSSPGDPVALNMVISRAGKKLSLLFPPIPESQGQTYLLELRCQTNGWKRRFRKKTLPRFETRNGELPLWTFHQIVEPKELG